MAWPFRVPLRKLQVVGTIIRKSFPGGLPQTLSWESLFQIALLSLGFLERGECRAFQRLSRALAPGHVLRRFSLSGSLRNGWGARTWICSWARGFNCHRLWPWGETIGGRPGLGPQSWFLSPRGGRTCVHGSWHLCRRTCHTVRRLKTLHRDFLMLGPRGLREGIGNARDFVGAQEGSFVFKELHLPLAPPTSCSGSAHEPREAGWQGSRQTPHVSLALPSASVCEPTGRLQSAMERLHEEHSGFEETFL